MSPTPALSHQYRGSTVSTDLPSTPSLQAISFPDTQNPLEIIQYNPDSDAGGKSCRKRAFDDAPKSIVSQTLKHVSLEDENGDVQATMTTFGQRLKKRAVFSEQKRLETALARKEGVCYRCKASKRKAMTVVTQNAYAFLQCDLAQKQSPYESCKLCTRTKIYKNIKQMPCFNSDLKNILFFRSRPASTEPFFTTRELLFALEEVSRLRVRIETLKLTQRIGDHKLIVYASEFDPLPGDVVSYKWTDAQGHHREMMMPHVSLTFIEKVAMHIRQYIDQAKRDYLKTYLVGLRSQDNLARMTIIAAMDYAKTREGSLVDIALDLWAICRMIEIPWERCGDDTLGVSQVKDPTNPHHGKFPIPPIMDTQLDQVVIQYILAPLREKLIEKLEASIAPPKPETWFETYLAVFILLNHIEQLAHHSASHAKLHTLPTMYSNVPFLEGVFHTAKTVLSRFHFVCNGSAPFRLDWTSKAATSMARLEPKQVEFMRRSQEIIQETENDVLSLRTSHQYGRCLYWCHQLFFDNWDSSFPVQVKVY
ncbi:hypothetical protein B0T17DRAFT_482151 [Bombardia bombarda]|uniref:Uncharacterized protein n=1 Tax=Bombardia bombarda TaxID=252184 RepID=A0AA39XM45_9PEZI|nr:hypothetical protein B0T17DRAFT_482151 [Bombardia bombarda]